MNISVVNPEADEHVKIYLHTIADNDSYSNQLV
jgi:hypothetical protein